MTNDAPLQALLLPFANGTLPWPSRQGALFLHARLGAALQWLPTPGLVVAQDDRRQWQALQRAGYPMLGDNDRAARPLLLALPPRQRAQARAVLAQALERCTEGGLVVASVANDSGAKAIEGDLKRLAGLDGGLSKWHCRVFWCVKDSGRIDQALWRQWRQADAPRRLAGGWLSRPGVFAWDRVDPGSALLAQSLPTDLAGAGADLGVGWGYLAMQVLGRCPRVAALDLYDADRRALTLAQQNLAAHAGRVELGFHWHDVTAGLPRRYDFIVSNPPFHGHRRAAQPQLGQAFIAAAAQALRPGGRLLLVANRHLPYADGLHQRFMQVSELARGDGFKVVQALKGPDGARR